MSGAERPMCRQSNDSRKRGRMTSPVSIALENSGAYSLMDFSRKHPSASLAELAHALGALPPQELERRFIEEAQDLDELRINVQELLYRYVLNVGAGWPAIGDANGQRELREQLAKWQGCARAAHFDAVLSAVSEELLAATHIPAGWKPDSAKAPWLAEPFEKLWKLP
jgi:hypothetical protein